MDFSKTRLDFDEVEIDFFDKKTGVILEAFMHNQEERVTIIKEGFVAITFVESS